MAGLLGASYLLWLRDSSLVQVRTVEVTGLGGPASERIRAALTATARGMTTLHVDRDKLERAASAFPALRGIEVHPDFPHGMRIHLLSHRPVALLAAGSRRVAVGADGTVLTGLPAKGHLPLIRVSGAIPVRQVPQGAALARVRVAGGIPPVLRSRVTEVVSERGKGVVVRLDDGPKLIFGDAGRIAAKWAAAVGVLADPGAAAAAYVDVRIPGRPAAGGLPVKTVAPLEPAGAPASSAAPAAAATPTRDPEPPAGTADQAAPGGIPGASAPAPAQQPPAPAPVTPLAPAAPGGGAVPNPQP